MLRLRPYTVKRALPFVRRVHRRLPKVQGALWAVSVWAGSEIVGVALVGHPARELMDDTLAVLRVAVIEGHRNACSMLYGSCSRAARAMGADNLVTYTHGDEDGTSLKAAGWIDDGLTDGGEWDRPDRPRQLALDPEPKRRWWAPWSERAKRERQGAISMTIWCEQCDSYRASAFNCGRDVCQRPERCEQGKFAHEQPSPLNAEAGCDESASSVGAHKSSSSLLAGSAGSIRAGGAGDEDASELTRTHFSKE